jgi:hypothetical protein
LAHGAETSIPEGWQTHFPLSGGFATLMIAAQ